MLKNLHERKTIKNLISLLTLPISLTLFPFCKIFNVKFYRIRSSRIGHFTANTELFLRRREMGLISNKHKVIGITTKKPCNDQLFEMIKRKINIIQISDNPKIRWISRQFSSKRSFLYKFGLYRTLPFSTNEYREFSFNKPNFIFNEYEEMKGKSLLNKMQVDNWFICLHSREPFYLDKQWKNGDKSHGFRDCNIKNYLLAAKHIASKGGFAIRIGALVPDKLSSENKKIIDYANNFRTDFGDIFLPAKCKFFLGNTSGPFLISTIFDVPSACANLIPIRFPNLLEKDLFIPKKLWFIKEKRFLTFKEMIQGESFNFNRSEEYVKAGLIPVENTSEEILDLANEMNQRIDGTWKETEEDKELQRKYKSLFPENSHCYGFPSKIGALFLRKNRGLLE